MTSQVLDSMELEREKGITIKARAVPSLRRRGRPDLRPQPHRHARARRLHYEVSRSLQACEGAILVIDASQGIEAQTLANVHLAMAQDLTIIPVINKIDLASADQVVMGELEETLAIPREDVLLVSAKDGTGVDDVLEAIVHASRPRLPTSARRSRRSSSTATTTRTRASSPTSGWPPAHSTTTSAIRFMATGAESRSSSATSARRRSRASVSSPARSGTSPAA